MSNGEGIGYLAWVVVFITSCLLTGVAIVISIGGCRTRGTEGNQGDLEMSHFTLDLNELDGEENIISDRDIEV